MIKNVVGILSGQNGKGIKWSRKRVVFKDDWEQGVVIYSGRRTKLQTKTWLEY